ncbi:hypothetical protein AB6813_19325 [bacterium RCC_150]
MTRIFYDPVGFAEEALPRERKHDHERTDDGFPHILGADEAGVN